MIMRLPTKISFPVKLIDTERQCIGGRRVIRVLGPIVIMIISGDKCPGEIRMESMRPFQRGTGILVSVSLHLIEMKTVVAEISGQRQTIIHVKTMIDRGVQVVKTSVTVLISALLRQ